MADFPWVEHRAKCSAFEVIQQIREGVGEDIKARNAQIGTPGPMVFKFREDLNPHPSKFGVICIGHNVNDAIDFSITSDGKIQAAYGPNRIEATLGLNEEGKCVIVVNGRELENWQFRKLALDAFFRF